MDSNLSGQEKKQVITRKLQVSFAIRVLVLIAMASLATLGSFLFIARETQTIGYRGTELSLLPTTEYFFPVLLLSAIGIIIVVSLIGAVVLIQLLRRFD